MLLYFARPTEVRVADRWVHVDPCEAAVDEPLLYESWGKNQTYILAFSRDGIVDVTDTYTSNMTAAVERRSNTPAELAGWFQSAASVLTGIGSLGA